MNLFMHYAFDVWMKRTNPSCPFARYADDAVVHCSSRQQAEQVMRSIAERLAECGLTMHLKKSKIVAGSEPAHNGARYCQGPFRMCSSHSLALLSGQRRP
jgi:hypothetical protein